MARATLERPTQRGTTRPLDGTHPALKQSQISFRLQLNDSDQDNEDPSRARHHAHVRNSSVQVVLSHTNESEAAVPLFEVSLRRQFDNSGIRRLRSLHEFAGIAPTPCTSGGRDSADVNGVVDEDSDGRQHLTVVVLHPEQLRGRQQIRAVEFDVVDNALFVHEYRDSKRHDAVQSVLVHAGKWSVMESGNVGSVLSEVGTRSPIGRGTALDHGRNRVLNQAFLRRRRIRLGIEYRKDHDAFHRGRDLQCTLRG